MLKTRSSFDAGVIRHRLIFAIAVLCFGPFADNLAFAADVPTLYTAEVALDERSKNPRDDAYKAALTEVLGRVSGSELSRDDAAIDALFPVPAAYVTQFRPGTEGTLWVSFDGEAIERVLRGAGHTVWGRDRPLTLVWLAVDWGQGDREIIAAGDPDRSQPSARSIDRNRLLRERLVDIATQRGLPLAFPLLDTTDLQSVTFSDIWGGFDDRIVDASKRYDANSILIGRVRPSSGQANRWTYTFGGQTLNWTGPPENVVGQIADLLAAEFALGGNLPLESLLLNVSGIQTVDAYGAVQNLLSGVGVIEKIRITEVAGDVVSYEIDVRGGAQRLRRSLRFAGLLEQEAIGRVGGPARSADLEFFYSP